jgi:hypothetical protein
VASVHYIWESDETTALLIEEKEFHHLYGINVRSFTNHTFTLGVCYPSREKSHISRRLIKHVWSFLDSWTNLRRGIHGSFNVALVLLDQPTIWRSCDPDRSFLFQKPEARFQSHFTEAKDTRDGSAWSFLPHQWHYLPFARAVLGRGHISMERLKGLGLYFGVRSDNSSFYWYPIAKRRARDNSRLYSEAENNSCLGTHAGISFHGHLHVSPTLSWFDFVDVDAIRHVYYVPFYFQAIRGTTAEQSGIRCIAYLISNTIGAIAVGGIVTVVGFYTPFIWFGTAREF